MSVHAFAERAAELAALFGVRSASSLSDDDLLASLDSIGELRRRIDSLGVQLAHEVQERSGTGECSLSRRLGMRTTASLVEERVGLDSAEASIWCSLADDTSPRTSLQGELLPPTRPVIAEALQSAGLSVGAAHRIAMALRQVEPFIDTAERESLEVTLVGVAPQLTRRELGRLCRSLPDRIDPDGAEPREEALRARSGIRILRDGTGLTTWIVTLDPESAGFLTTAIDARTAPRRRPRFLDSTELDLEIVDDRPLSARRFDALIDIARESLAHDDGQVAGSPVTMVVTVPLEALQTGIGVAQIAGVDEPVSAATARRLAADAQIIPTVLGGESEILDQGRARRLATPAQRAALATQDGGCLWPGCTAPPGWCEVAHILAWMLGGGTDLDNLMLLCPFHHRRFDHDGWRLERRGPTPWFIPPPHVDATRRPRRGGRLPLAA